MFDRGRFALVVVGLFLLFPFTVSWASATQTTINFNNGFGTLTYDMTYASGACGQNGSYTEYQYNNLTYVDPNGRSWSLGGGGTYYSSTLSEQQGCPPSGPEPSSITYGDQGDGWQITWYPGAGGASAGIEQYANLTPKFQVLSLFYAPPGHASYVDYENITTVGTSVSLSQSFSESYGVTVKSSGIVSSSSAANTFSQEQDSSSSVDLSKTTGWTFEIKGPQPKGSQTDDQMDALGLDHDYDLFMVWLDPALSFEESAGGGSVWGGYQVNPANSTGDIEYVLLSPGMMKSSSFPSDLKNSENAWYDPDLYSDLQRSWDTTMSSPALTSADYNAILAQDPFAQDPHATTVSATPTRYTRVSNFDISYQTSQTAEKYTLAIQATSSQGQGASISFSTSHGWANTYSSAENVLEESMKNTATLTMEDKWSSTITQKVGQSATASITGPTANSKYSGPNRFLLYQDNIYGTFMFYPSTS